MQWKAKGVNFEQEKRKEVEEEEIQVDYVDDDFDDDDSEEDHVSYRFMPSPLVPLKDHLEKDKVYFPSPVSFSVFCLLGDLRCGIYENHEFLM